MSARAIERRFNVQELEFLTETLGKVIKNYENEKASSLLIDNVPKAKLILERFIGYHTRLEKYIKKCQENIDENVCKDWYVKDNEIFVQSTIGVILPLEDYYVLYFYLDDAKLTGNGYINNIIISLRDELAKKIAFTSSWRYLCDHGIERTID